MKITSVKNMYFSPTGGTKKVTTILSHCFSLPTEEIDFSLPSFLENNAPSLSFSPETLCIIGVPSFGGRVPAIALKNLSTLQGNHAPTILVTSYGNRDFEDTLLELKDALQSQGFSCIAAISAVTEHSIMHQFGTGRPDANDEQQLRSFVAQIKEKLKNITCPQDLAPVIVPGNHPYRPYGTVPIYPKVSSICEGCGLCAKKCPVNAIPKETPNKTDESLCISCMRCISVCPKKARQCNQDILMGLSQKLKDACSSKKENALFL